MTQAVERAPGSVRARSRRAQYRLSAGDPSGALEDYRAALEMDPEHEEQWKRMVELARRAAARQEN